MYRTFLIIITPICLILLLVNLFDLKLFTNKETLSQKIQKDIDTNPTASNIDDNILKRVTVFDEENGLVKEQVVYEESILSEEEYNELKKELE